MMTSDDDREGNPSDADLMLRKQIIAQHCRPTDPVFDPEDYE